ncbi:MAG: hypothetical protein ACTSPM_00220 [Candidatus Heimdallarchaeota archaeon]
MTDPEKKSTDSKKKESKDELSDLADRLVKTMSDDLYYATRLDTAELDRLEREKELRLDRALDEPLPEESTEE